MHFGTKNYLKNNRNHTTKYTRPFGNATGTEVQLNRNIYLFGYV